MPILTGQGKITSEDGFVLVVSYVLIASELRQSERHTLMGSFEHKTPAPLKAGTGPYLLHTEDNRQLPISLSLVNPAYDESSGWRQLFRPSADTDWYAILFSDK